MSRGVRWVFQNIERYGGDTSRVLLMGQSAGAHLAAMLLLEHSLLEAKHLAKGGKEEADNWSVKDLKGFLGISGPYHLEKLGPHLASRGLYPGIMTHMTGGDLLGCSPEALLQQDDWKAFGDRAADLLPPIHLFHGDRETYPLKQCKLCCNVVAAKHSQRLTQNTLVVTACAQFSRTRRCLFGPLFTSPAP